MLKRLHFPTVVLSIIIILLVLALEAAASPSNWSNAQPEIGKVIGVEIEEGYTFQSPRNAAIKLDRSDDGMKVFIPVDARQSQKSCETEKGSYVDCDLQPWIDIESDSPLFVEPAETKFSTQHLNGKKIGSTDQDPKTFTDSEIDDVEIAPEEPKSENVKIIRGFVGNKSTFQPTKSIEQTFNNLKPFLSEKDNIFCVITTEFNLIRFVKTVRKQNHFGTDCRANFQEVYAPADGLIVYTGQMDLPGNIMIVDHGHEFYSVWMHLAKFITATSSTVKAGEVIAKSGNTGGRSTAPHLHVTFIYKGAIIDPLQFYSVQPSK